MVETNLNLCRSGLHPWRDPENRRRCCNGYTRVRADTREELQRMGCEHITLAGSAWGWLKQRRTKRV